LIIDFPPEKFASLQVCKFAITCLLATCHSPLANKKDADETPTSFRIEFSPDKKKKAAGVCALRPLEFMLCQTLRQRAHYDKELFHFR
jgi:hypothetical protein